MTVSNSPLTATALVAAAERVLEGAGFKAIVPPSIGAWTTTAPRVYEDAYSIVCVAVYETWADLSSRWLEDQASLVDLISKHFSRTEAKAWDGYLVLLTPSVVPASDRMNAINIQRNTLHLRKLFADGDELRSVDAVRRTLLPLLPLEEHDGLETRNVFDTLPSLLASRGVDEAVAKVAIEAFRDQKPIVAEIHAFIMDKRGQQP